LYASVFQKFHPDHPVVSHFPPQNRNIVLSKEPSAEERAAANEAKAARKAANEAEDREEQLRAAAEAGELDEEGDGEEAASVSPSASVPVLRKQKSVAGECITSVFCF
jgi:hypothetical protein